MSEFGVQTQNKLDKKNQKLDEMEEYQESYLKRISMLEE